MASKIEYQFDISQKPWLRPQYYINNDISFETIVPSLKVDFQEDIKAEFIAEIHRRNVANRFPRDNDISVSIEVSSMINILLPMVSKNVLDALNGVAFIDDVNVSSTYVALSNNKENLIKVRLYLNKSLVAKRKPFVMFTINTKPIDKIIPLPRYTSQKVRTNPENIKYQNIVRTLINKQKNHPIIKSDMVMSFDITTTSFKNDLDNIVINYLCAMKNVVFKDIYQIKALHMNIKRLVRGKEHAVVSIEELSRKGSVS